MPNSRRPLFLARASYRKRRLRDGARILPLFGLVLVLLPLMWPAIPQRVGAHWLFLFLAWLGLIALTALFARDLGEPDAPPQREAADEDAAASADLPPNSRNGA